MVQKVTVCPERSIWWGHAGSDMVESLEGNVGYQREK